MNIIFGNWLPDEPDYDSAGLVIALNVLPTATRGFAPVRSFAPFSDALAAKPLGAYGAKALDGTAFNYAGTGPKLYQLSGTGWLDITRATGGDYTVGEMWEFDEWNQWIFAVNHADNPQFAVKSAGGQFADTFPSETFRARHIGVVGNFVVYGDIVDIDGDGPHRIRWSGLADPFTITPDPVTQSDRRDLHSYAGAVQRVVGGEIGVIFQERAISRMDYIGGDLAFDVSEVEETIGTLSPKSVVKVGNRVFFLAQDGFRRFDYATESVPIGESKVDNYVLDRIDPSRLREVVGVPLPGINVVMWFYPGPDAPAGVLDSGITYNYVSDRWTELSEDTMVLPYWGVSNAVSPDDASISALNVDEQPGSADDAIWTGGAFQLASFDIAYKLSFLDQYTRVAVFETPEIQLAEDRRTWMDGCRPLIDLGVPGPVLVGHRNDLEEDVVWEQAQPKNAAGRFPLRINARYIRFNIGVTGFFKNAIGVELMGALSDAR